MTDTAAALVAAYGLAVNAALFAMMGADKRKARRRARRIPERTLFAAALLGGATGGWIGMRVWRHKTKHAAFVWGFPLLALADLALALRLALPDGWFH